jgi:hypothetical protein
MSNPPDDRLKVAVSSQFVPGSVAEEQYKERIRRFQIEKAERKNKEAREEPEKRQQRDEAFEAHKEAVARPRMPARRP